MLKCPTSESALRCPYLERDLPLTQNVDQRRKASWQYSRFSGLGFCSETLTGAYSEEIQQARSQ
jgi:hypothetical protein